MRFTARSLLVPKTFEMTELIKTGFLRAVSFGLTSAPLISVNGSHCEMESARAEPFCRVRVLADSAGAAASFRVCLRQCMG
jgi:hypothetical protein